MKKNIAPVSMLISAKFCDDGAGYAWPFSLQRAGEAV